MRTILMTALALAALTSAALADGAVELTDTQLDQITAGNRLQDYGIDTLPGLPTFDPEEARRTVPSGSAKATYYTSRIAGSRVATPGVNVARMGNPVVKTVFIP